MAVAAAVTGVLLAAGPAVAQDREDKNDLIVLTGQAHVLEGETFDTVVILDGPATIEGTVTHSVVAFNGPVTISGSVAEEVVAFNGTITVQSGATVGGDLVSRTDPVVEEGAVVEGEIGRDPGRLFRDPFPFIGRLASWLAVSVSILLLGVLLLALAPRAADAVDAAWRTAVGPSVGWGLVLLIGLPILAILAFITLVGIPFGVGLALGLFLIYSLGYTAGAWVLGRALLKPPTSRFVAFLVGLVILRAVALVPILAGIVGTIATLVGLGAIAVALWRARRATLAPAPAHA
jgi:cytoskeletal protein CcmA (bactofilin family)